MMVLYMSKIPSKMWFGYAPSKMLEKTPSNLYTLPLLKIFYPSRHIHQTRNFYTKSTSNLHDLYIKFTRFIHQIYTNFYIEIYDFYIEIYDFYIGIYDFFTLKYV